ncbi:MAG: DUF3826 domain-containing protein [Arachidicoccus sp.]|nr:DUF3826 domain-containing protein [Arachidicoccus sp.]
MNLKRIKLIVTCVFSGIIFIAKGQTGSGKDTAYISSINQRARKIVAKLNIQDKEKQAKVQSVVARQYFDLNDISTRRDSSIKNIKTKNLSKVAENDSIAAFHLIYGEETYQLHYAYIAKLQTLLTLEQVDEIKNGMTYGVLPLTYNGYMQMLPNLTNEQKYQIMAWLVEAREHAIDGGTSNEKHAWFGKYKGRINNYLAKDGIDMKKAESDWISKINSNKKNTSSNHH